MKTEWQYRFETTEFIFEKEHKFIGSNKGELDFGFGEISNLNFEARISPEQETDYRPGVIQSGSIYITLGMGMEEAHPVADFLIHQIVERIAFISGKISIVGIVYCERIPETPEEVEIVGDKPHAAFLQLEEVIDDSSSFDSKQFQGLSGKSLDVRLLSQFNDACNEPSTVYQFIGLYQILESLYSGSKEYIPGIKKVFKSSKQLRNNFEKTFEHGEFDNFIEEIVDIRHNCAHLRLEAGFGYAPNDPRIKEQVEPYVGPIKELCYVCIQDV